MSLDLDSRYDLAIVTSGRFAEYHDMNPHVYAVLRRYALDEVRAGRTRLSISRLFERARWEGQLETVGNSFKVDNSMRAFYSRALMENEAELAGKFSTRKSKADRAA